MHKLAILVMTIGLALAGCTTQTFAPAQHHRSVKVTTQKVIQAPTKTWTFDQAVSSSQTKHGVASNLDISVVDKTTAQSSWTTSNGQFLSAGVKHRQVSYAKWHHDQQRHIMKSYRHRLHHMSVSQINAVLKKLGTSIQINKLTDLIYLESGNHTDPLPVNTAFAAKGHHLYAVNIQYSDTEQATTIERGCNFTDTSAKAAPKRVNVANLNGTWIAAETTTSASDTGKLLIKDGYLYQHRYDSYERSAIQDLSHYSLGSLNQNVTYAAFKTDAAHAGYQLTHTAVASGDSTGMLYLIINANKIIRINQQIVTTYTKTSAVVAANDLPKTDVDLFKQMDQKKAGEVATTITVKAGPAQVGMTNSINYLTDPNAGQITETIVVN
ncbi:hypothetical protein [Lactiplantibacillus plantarum]|uniref:hypothetical protein n=1 Tax=Lactiplantibacillus plantarum TaxID=1590 RepID=UPI0021822CF2|nr:hypothetical protein [Lactiplantibacillus plantarum]MCT0194380.1 hypothetical protein [Lactiplantibacillus plantarum]